MSVQVAVITQAGDRGEWVLARPSLDSINDKLPAEADNNHITKSRSTYRITWERPIALEGEKVILYRDEMIPNRAYPIFRIEPQDLKICIPKVFTKHRRFPFSDEFHSFHAFSDGRIEWEKH
ncbi:MAG: hypothetical protein P8X92_07825 [Dehalococcoidia bacterium]